MKIGPLAVAQNRSALIINQVNTMSYSLILKDSYIKVNISGCTLKYDL